MQTATIRKLEWLILISDKIDFKRITKQVIGDNNKSVTSSGTYNNYTYMHLTTKP